jgi:hypothetical protein
MCRSPSKGEKVCFEALWAEELFPRLLTACHGHRIGPHLCPARLPSAVNLRQERPLSPLAKQRGRYDTRAVTFQGGAILTSRSKIAKLELLYDR